MALDSNNQLSVEQSGSLSVLTMYFASLFLDIIVLVSCFLLAVYVYLKHTLKYWEKKNVPHRKPQLLFGNFADSLLMKRPAGEVTKEIYEEFSKDRFVGGYFSHTKVMIVRDPELIKSIMTKDFYHFYSRGIVCDPIKEPINLNLFATNGDLWRVLRQNLTPLFSSAKLKNMFKLMTMSGKHFENYLRDTIKSDQIPVNVNDLMPTFSLDVIGSCAFGVNANTMDDSKDNVFKKMGLKIFEGSTINLLKFIFRTTAMRLFYFFNLTFFDPEVDKFFVDLVRDTVQERERSQITRHDFIDLMKELKREGVIKGNSIDSLQSGEQKVVEIKVDDNLMAAQSFIFFAAGFETSSTTMSYALYELAKNPEIQTKVIEEIDSVLAKTGNEITYDSLRDLELLDMVVSETLRKYPVLGNLERVCTSPYKIPNTDVTIDEGVKIFIPLLAIQRDPQYYPDPEKFDPYRFTKEAVNERHPYVYMPFGQGPRICIGLRFGKAQVAVGLVSLLKNYTVHPSEKTPGRIIFHPKTFVTTPKDGIWLNLKRRENKT